MSSRKKHLLACALGLAAAIASSQAADVSVPSAPGGTQPYSAEAMWQLQRLATPTISPDGRLAAVAVSGLDPESRQQTTNLWLVPTRPGKARQLTGGNTSDYSPAWSPDGRWIAFVSRRGDDKQPQIYIIPVDGGEARRITNVPTGAMAPKWFPDSQRIAFLSRVWSDIGWEATALRLAEREETRMSGRIWDRAPVAHWDRLLDDRSTHLFWIAIEDGEPQPITLHSGRALDAGQPGADSYDIAPDGLEVAFAADSDTTGRDPNFDIYTMSVEGGAAVNLTPDNTADDNTPRFSPDGRLLAFGRQLTRDFYADRVRLTLFDRRTREIRSLAADWDRSAEGFVWSPDSRTLFGTAEDQGSRRVFRFDLSGNSPAAVTTGSSYSDLAVAGNGPVIIALRSSFSEPPALVSVIPRTGAATRLSDFNDARLATLAQGRVESVQYPGANGDPVQMWVVYPPDFTPARQWPLLLLLHGGPHDSVTDAVQWRWNAQVFASWGYVVAWPNFHGSSGFGQAFAESTARDWAELPYQDTLRAADWFLAQPWIDATRLAAGGGSYGGYLAAVLLGREHPFRTLIAHAPVYDLFGQYANDKGANLRRFGEQWEDRARFERNSPHLAAGNFATPTLVIHGELDRRVPVAQGLALFNTLQNRGIKSRLLYFPDENHWIQKPENSLFWYASVRTWLQEQVAPGPGEASPLPAAAETAPAAP